MLTPLPAERTLAAFVCLRILPLESLTQPATSRIGYFLSGEAEPLNTGQPWASIERLGVCEGGLRGAFLPGQAFPLVRQRARSCAALTRSMHTTVSRSRHGRLNSFLAFFSSGTVGWP
jgi:hypothetical protein